MKKSNREEKKTDVVPTTQKKKLCSYVRVCSSASVQLIVAGRSDEGDL